MNKDKLLGTQSARVAKVILVLIISCKAINTAYGGEGHVKAFLMAGKDQGLVDK